MRLRAKYLAALLIACGIANGVDAQQRLSKEQIMSMSIEELSDLPLEELMEAVETLGVSSVDELFAMIMNKNVSSASKAEENSFTSPLSSTVITQNEMRTYGVTTIEEAFRLIPGMIVQEKTNGVYDVEMRGLNNIPDNLMFLYSENQNILVMIDGRICHNYATGSPTFENLPIGIEDIDRIEVVRGATSALYGPNAINGVVNIITLKPDLATTKLSGNFQMGNNTGIGNVSIHKRLSNKLSLGLTANMQNRTRKVSTLYMLPVTGGHMPGMNSNYVTSDKSVYGKQFTDEELAELISKGVLKDVSDGGNLSTEELNRLVYMIDNTAYRAESTDYDFEKAYKKPDMARENVGINGYVAITPKDGVRIDITGGFQDAKSLNTPVGNENVPVKVRTSRTGYFATEANVKDLRLLLNYNGGPQDYAYGSNGFKVHTHMLNGEVDYDFRVGDLSIRPTLSYQYIYYKDYDNGYSPDGQELSGFFGYYSDGENDAKVTDLAPSLRLDYKKNGLRLIAAFREDKTNMPDKWNPTWQFAANYEINDNNFVRLVYGRSRRSVSIANASSQYTWTRKQMYHPNEIQFFGNPNADLPQIDNYELGYRWKPTKNILIDAEAFYSLSKKFGSLGSDKSLVYMKSDDLGMMLGTFSTIIGGAMEQGTTDINEILTQVMPYMGQLANMMHTKAYIKYELLPYEVKQMGISMNMDWIISPKLIAKLNANVQKTTIDNYYPYSQSDAISTQLQSAMMQTQGSLMNFDNLESNLLVELMMSGMATGDLMSYLSAAQHYAPIHDYINEFKSDPEGFKNRTHAAYMAGEAYGTAKSPIALYYGTKYNIEFDESRNQYYFGGTGFTHEKPRNGYKHKATPSFYGMFGLIYKPMKQLEISGFANFMSKRKYVIQYNHAGEDLDARCTVNLKVGYKPIENCEIFLNGHNLFNSEKREFPFTDKVGGIYTVGVNFGI